MTGCQNVILLSTTAPIQDYTHPDDHIAPSQQCYQWSCFDILSYISVVKADRNRQPWGSEDSVWFLLFHSKGCWTGWWRFGFWTATLKFFSVFKSLSCGKLETNQSQGECIIENNVIDRQFHIIAIQTTLSQWKPL